MMSVWLEAKLTAIVNLPSLTSQGLLHRLRADDDKPVTRPFSQIFGIGKWTGGKHDAVIFEIGLKRKVVFQDGFNGRGATAGGMGTHSK